MSEKHKIWYYLDDKGKTIGPMSEEDLLQRADKGEIRPTTGLWREGFTSQQARPFNQIQIPRIKFNLDIDELLEARLSQDATIFCGPNNSGKSFLLKKLRDMLGIDSYLVNVVRFYHVNQINNADTTPDKRFAYYQQDIQEWHTANQNRETNRLTLDEILRTLTDVQHELIFDICGQLTGNKFALKQTNEEKRLSPWYVDMDGENLAYGSTGTRLLMTICGICADPSFKYILIDEPELGLSPQAQSALAKLLLDPDMRNETFPHLKHVLIATHSHLFLDKFGFRNNFAVTKSGDLIEIKQVEMISEFHDLQFRLLGNDLESLFLPSAMVIVEGESDQTFLKKAINLHISGKKITVAKAKSDGDIVDRVQTLRDSLDIENTPYLGKIFVVLDARHSVKKDRLIRQGIPENNIIIWSKNGVEYLYPFEVMKEIFSTANESELDKMKIEGNDVTLNQITKTKKELATLVSEKMTSDTPLNDEITKKLLSQLENSV